MSSLANCHNQSTSAPISESDNDNENEFDSSLHPQNESMMHKVKDVVSKFLHPSFLFSSNEDTDRSKRKRSTSVEEEQTTTITTDTSNNHTTTSRYDRSTITNDEPQLTDDEDSNSHDVPSTDPDSTPMEQQKKRRRTANYQHILSTNGHDDDNERTASPLAASTDSVRSVSTRRIDHSSLITQSPNERINRFTPAKQRFDVLPTYRGSPSSYDPTKSPLFSTGNRKTTATNLKSEEFSANYLLASGLVSRPQSSSSQSQQSPATLTKPTTTTTRQMFGVNYSSINSRRLPYIERLRRRTLQDCIRLNRTVDSEPLSESVIEEHKSTPASPVAKRIKAPDKDCGIQCDISIVQSSIEPSKKSERTFPPGDIRNESLTIPTVEKSQSASQTDSFIQTNSSITIERVQPKFDITKPKVLGNVTPFSWPKFARAQEEYARKYPEKCRTDAVVPTKSVPPSNIGNSNETGDIWKCPSCTKEHPAQTATCSLCRQINPNYKKPSAVEPTATPTKEPVSFGKLPSVVVKEPNPSTPIANPTTTITKENVSSVPPTRTFPMFGVTPATSLSVPSQESTTTATLPIFGVTASTSSPVTAEESTISSTAPVTTSPLSTSPLVSTVKETPTATPLLNFTPIVSSPPATTQNTPVSTSATSLPFSVAPTITTTKENPVTTSSPFMFGTTATAFDKTLPISENSPFPSGRLFQPSLPVASTSAAVVVTTSTVPSFNTITPNLSKTTSFGTFDSTSIAPATTIPFGTFGSVSLAPSTTTAVTAAAPVVSTISSVQVPAFTFTSSTSTPSLPTTIPTSSALFGVTSVVPAPAVNTSTLSFPTPSATTSTFTNSSTSTLTTTSTPFGSGALGLTTSNPRFSFGTAATAPTFGTIPPFGTSSPFGMNPTPVDNTTSSASPFGGSSTTLPFSFGSTLGTTQTSSPPVPSGGFPFPSAAPTIPVFGTGPSPLSSGGNSSSFVFAGSPVPAPATNTPFQFSGRSPLPSNPFSTPAPVDSDDTPNPFSIGETESSSTVPRRILRATRRKN